MRTMFFTHFNNKCFKKYVFNDFNNLCLKIYCFQAFPPEILQAACSWVSISENLHVGYPPCPAGFCQRFLQMLELLLASNVLLFIRNLHILLKSRTSHQLHNTHRSGIKATVLFQTEVGARHWVN